jgi:uncharacterized membrane protein
MNIIIQIALITHIASGSVSLLAGLIAILSPKGNKIHRTAGKIFFYSMLLVSASAITISLLKGGSFLLMIGIFAFFLNYSGYRSVKNKEFNNTSLDWFVLAVAACNSITMLLSFNIILVVFGGLSTFLVIGDLRIFIQKMRNRPVNRQQWIIRHIGMMLGAYIATSTAFLVVNVTNFQPAWLPWLMPTFLGVPLILYWIRKKSN